MPGCRSQAGTFVIGVFACTIGPVVLTFKSSSVNGYPDVNWMQIVMNYGLEAVGACYLLYYPADDAIFLAADGGYGWVANGTVGGSSPASIANSQCSVDLPNSSAVKWFNDVTLRLRSTFQPALPGLQEVYQWTGDRQELQDPWRQMGTWTTSTVNPPWLWSVTPPSGSGVTDTWYTFRYEARSDPGYTYLAHLDALLNSSATLANGCYVYYNRAGNYVMLGDDAGGWHAPTRIL